MSPPSHRAATAYRSVGLQTRATEHNQYELVAMMFETTLECLNSARGAIQAGDVATKVKSIDKAIRIIQEGLRTSLDTANGGQLASNLAALYDYAVMRLTQANATNNAEHLSEVADLIKPVADAWDEIRPGGPGKGQAPEADQAPQAAASHPPIDNMARRTASMYGLGGAANSPHMLVGA